MCWQPWCGALLLLPCLLQTSLWSQKPLAWSHWEFLPIHTVQCCVSTAESFDGRWSQPRWLRTVFLCVWKTVGMPCVLRAKENSNGVDAGEGCVNVPVTGCSTSTLWFSCSNGLILQSLVQKWPHTVSGGCDSISSTNGLKTPTMKSCTVSAQSGFTFPQLYYLARWLGD